MIYLTEQERQSILRAAQAKYKDPIRQRVEAVMMRGEFLTAKPPFYSGWTSAITDHWGIVVGGFLHHLVFKLDEDLSPVGIEFASQSFHREWIKEGRVTCIQEIGSTLLSLQMLREVGETLILKFGSHQKVYKNSQTFADILVQIVCDEKLDSPFQIAPTSLLAFPLTTTRDTLLSTNHKRFVKVKKTIKPMSWEEMVDAEIMDEINNIRLTIVPKKSSCSLL